MRALRWHGLAGVLCVLLGLGGARAQSLDPEVPQAALQRGGEVLHRLAAAYGIPPPELVVTPSDAPNAFSNTRQGRPVIGLSTGLLRIAGDREEYLAAVIGHELAHLQARHAAQREEYSTVATFVGVVLGAAIDITLANRGRTTYGAGMLLGGLGGSLASARFTRDQEREADRIGTEAMARAGYDPAGAAGYWRLVATKLAGPDGSWFSMHPSHAEREAELSALAAQLQPLYEANRGKALLAGGVPVRVGYGDMATLGQQALLYLKGAGQQPKDPAKARAYGERAMQAGDPVGKAVYGTVLRDGIAGDADPARGIQLLQEAAEHHVPWAHYQLGVAYRNGLGVPIDRERALQHLGAAVPALIEAQDLLSRMRSESR